MFGRAEVGLEAKFNRNRLSRNVEIFPNFDKKSQVLTLGRDLAAILKIQIFGILNI